MSAVKLHKQEQVKILAVDDKPSNLVAIQHLLAGMSLKRETANYPVQCIK